MFGERPNFERRFGDSDQTIGRRDGDGAEELDGDFTCLLVAGGGRSIDGRSIDDTSRDGIDGRSGTIFVLP
jgi:hypothetical protein